MSYFSDIFNKISASSSESSAKISESKYYKSFINFIVDISSLNSESLDEIINIQSLTILSVISIASNIAGKALGYKFFTVLSPLVAVLVIGGIAFKSYQSTEKVKEFVHENSTSIIIISVVIGILFILFQLKKRRRIKEKSY